MASGIRRGEAALAAVFAAAGIFWVAVASGMQMWDGFAPASGFLPFVFGVLLIALSLAAGLSTAFAPADSQASAAGGVRRPLLVLLTLAVATTGIETVGFCASVFVATLFLFRVAEKLPILASLFTAAGTAIGLTLVFRTWLGVPLPAGPWGF